MMTEEEKLQERIDKAVRSAKAPLDESINTLTRALADEHRRVDEAVKVRHLTEIDRNSVAGTLKTAEQDKTGLKAQVTKLTNDLKVAEKFHLEVLGCLASHGIPTPQAGYLKAGSSSILRDLDLMTRLGKKPS